MLRSIPTYQLMHRLKLLQLPPTYYSQQIRHVAKPSISVDNTTVIENMYNKWLKNPSSVHPSWDRYFREAAAFSANASTKKVTKVETKVETKVATPTVSTTTKVSSTADLQLINDHLHVEQLIKSYQTRGHLVADLDPLGIKQVPILTDFGLKRRASELVTKKYFDFTEKDLDREFQLHEETSRIGGDKKSLTLREIVKRLESCYCDKIGIEYMHLLNIAQVNFIREKFEKPGVINFTKGQKMLILNRLCRSAGFEAFLQRKYPSEKRFGLEGCEMMIPSLKHIIDASTNLGIDTIIMGLAHRGRLNTLANVFRKPLNLLFSQFSCLEATDSGSGDVKYHLGMFTERMNRQTNKKVRLVIVANPSHLEAVDPVVLGKTRAEQFYAGDKNGDKIMSLLLHGDASNSGQGVVYETLHLADLPNFTTHGTIHLVINNQIGFTTDPRFSRSSPHCTDVAKVVNAPIFHVNADEPEAVIYCCQAACEWRGKFHTDVVIDLVCYRRNGHNEIDDPSFTQPLMYQRIKQLKNCYELYAEKLIKDKILTTEENKKIWDDYQNICEKAFALSKQEKTMQFKDWLDSPWKGFFKSRDKNKIGETGVQEDVLKHIGKVFSSGPQNDKEFAMHDGIVRVLKARKEMVDKRIADWAFGEAFAFGSLLKEGFHVQLSGQDVERGTFSHRHHVLHDQKKDKVLYNPLLHLYDKQAHYALNNSSLSEYGVLGFQVGYSIANPCALVIWEGQFGDFANNAQCIIDQFLACGENKWVRQSGLVLLLPHGMEGMGAEHSSCRLERFLQSSDDESDIIPEFNKNFVVQQLAKINWIIANCSTPANLFHILRRQVTLPFRKPLILATPKSLLRLPACRSSFDDMLVGKEFIRLIPECGAPAKQPSSVKKLVFCTGKIYYDLMVAREERKKINEVAISRVEQICPFPYDLFIKEVEKYPNAALIWAQEEHKNQGCWSYLFPRIATVLCNLKGNRFIEYNGRGASAAPATGSKHLFLKEQSDYLNSLFGQKSSGSSKRKRHDK